MFPQNFDEKWLRWVNIA